MEEKRTLGAVIKANKGKIIKGAVIVVGVTAGIVVFKLLTKNGAKYALEAIGSEGAEMAEQAILGAVETTGKVIS